MGKGKQSSFTILIAALGALGVVIGLILPNTNHSSATRNVGPYAKTQMYRGGKRIGSVERNGEGTRFMPINCSYSGGYLVTNRVGSWVNVMVAQGQTRAGHAQRLGQEKWAIYGDSAGYGPIGYRGEAIRRGTRRWDVIGPGRTLGYVIGPDGPQAATALLVIC